MKHTPPSIEELKSLRSPLRNINIEHHEKLTKLEKVAVFVTDHVGTMGFFIVIFLWSAAWLGWNIFAPSEVRFDPYPAFVLWLFISNVIQLMILPLLMVGQNLQGRHAEARAEADFEINSKAEREIGVILQHLENQSELMEKMLNRLEQDK